MYLINQCQNAKEYRQRHGLFTDAYMRNSVNRKLFLRIENALTNKGIECERWSIYISLEQDIWNLLKHK